jgi:potassium efflux system protein
MSGGSFGFPQRSLIAIGRVAMMSLMLAGGASALGPEDEPAPRAARPVPVDNLPLLPAPPDATTSIPTPGAEGQAEPGRKVRGPSSLDRKSATGAGPGDLPADLDTLRTETADWLRRIDESAASGAPAGPDAKPSPEGRATSAVVSGLDVGKKGRSSRVARPAPGLLGPAAKVASPSAGPLRDVLTERQLLLDEYDRARKQLAALAGPGAAPAEMAAVARSELERLGPQIEVNSPFHLPSPFDSAPGRVGAAALGEMKEAIEHAKEEVKSWQSKLDAARAQAAGAGTDATRLHAERDKLFRRVATLKAKGQERETAVSAAKTAEERQLARERLTNAKLEGVVEDLRLKALEANLAREASLAEVRQLNRRVLEAQLRVSRTLLDQMQLRYRTLAESHERDLEQAAATEENKARQSDDPLERYRARRLAELLDAEAQVVKYEQSLATGARPALEEERALADRAESEFAQIKQLLDDGNVSRLDALRLNNDFRRIGPERDGLLRNELAAIETQIQFYENMLTNAELELIEDSMADQAELDALLDRLAPDRHARARGHFDALEKRHRSLLERRRAALTKLVARASETLQQVTRRLRTLEEEYGFIRTHIFWVRDQEPIGPATATLVGHELRRLLKGFGKLARETLEPKSWGRLSTEFLGATAAAIILPLGLFRLRRLLRRRITRALPPSHLHGSQAGTIRVDMSVAAQRA